MMSSSSVISIVESTGIEPEPTTASLPSVHETDITPSGRGSIPPNPEATPAAAFTLIVEDRA